MEHVANLVQVYMRHEMSLYDLLRLALMERSSFPDRKYYCPPTSKFYFKSGESSNLPHGLELWPAIFQ